MSSPGSPDGRKFLTSDVFLPRVAAAPCPVLLRSLQNSAVRSETYLDRLPNEALKNVVRHMSAKPRHRYWPSFIKTRDTRSLFRVGGSFSTVLPEQFTAVSISDKPWESQENGELFLRTEYDFAIVADVAGPTLQKISFFNLYDFPNIGSFAQTIASKCVSLKHIQLCGYYDDALFDEVLSKCCGRLESLCTSIETDENVLAMVRHCVGLRSLEITREEFDVQDLSALWPAVGKTLNKLCLSDNYSLKEQEFWGIQRHCRALRHIEVTGTKHKVAIADLFASYRHQLQHVMFEDMSAELCALVLNACPTLCCTALLSKDLVPVVRATGAALQDLELCYMHNMRLDGLGDAMKQCLHVKSLYLDLPPFDSHELVSAVFSSPKPELQSLKLEGYSSESCSDVVDCIAAKTGKLEVFSFSGTLLPPNLFLRMAQANPLLQRVRIDEHKVFGCIPEDASSIVADILGTFSGCPALRELDVLRNVRLFPDSVSVLDAYKLFRFKNTYVSVAGKDVLW